MPRAGLCGVVGHDCLSTDYIPMLPAFIFEMDRGRKKPNGIRTSIRWFALPKCAFGRRVLRPNVGNCNPGPPLCQDSMHLASTFYKLSKWHMPMPIRQTRISACVTAYRQQSAFFDVRGVWRSCHLWVPDCAAYPVSSTSRQSTKNRAIASKVQAVDGIQVA